MVDLEADNNIEARKKALEIAKTKKIQFNKPKSNFIAETFLVGW
ncbi:MAG: hypothetical protein ACP5C3_06340 [Methanomicrobiales archaeon]